ncbi:uncharacterized protein LOC102804551 isoform X2 [Saccoglossus kowalevskii]
MPTKAADLVDENAGQRDNIGCKGKMSQYRDSLREEKEVIETCEISKYDDENLQKTIDDIRLVLDVANYICSSLSEGMLMLPQTLQDTVEVIRSRIKVVPPWVKIDKNAVAVRLWKAANVMDQLSEYAIETEKLAKRTAALAAEASKKADMTASDLTAALKELQKAQADTESREKKEKEEKEKSDKKEIANEGKKHAEKVRKLADETSSVVNDAKKIVQNAEKLAKQSSGTNPEVPTKLEEAQTAIDKATEALVETKKSADAAESTSSNMADLSAKKNIPVDTVKQSEDQIQQHFEKANESSEEAKTYAKTAKRAGSKVVEIVEEEKARDKAWKTAKEAKSVAKAVRKDAEVANTSVTDSERLADDIKRDIEEAVTVEDSLRSLIEELKQVSENVTKAAEKAEIQSEEIEKLKTEGGESEDVARVTAETKDIIREAKESAESCKRLSAKAAEIGERAKILIEKQAAVATSKSFADEAQSLIAELRQLDEDATQAISKAKEMVGEENVDKSEMSKKNTETVGGTKSADLDCESILVDAETNHKEAAAILEEAEKSVEKTTDAAQDVEERYKTNHSVDDINKFAAKTGKCIEDTRAKITKATQNEVKAKSSATQIINHIDTGRTRILGNETLRTAKDFLQLAYKDLEESNSISTEAQEIASRVTSDMEDSETMVEGIKVTGTKAKGNAETLQRLVTDIEGRTSMLETSMAGADQLQKIKDDIAHLKQGIEEMTTVAEEAREVNKDCRTNASEIGQRVATHERLEASKSTSPLIDEAKRVARDARELVQEVKQSTKDTQQAADDCGRDTDEARRAIQIAEEAVQETRKAGSEATRSAESIDRAIDDLTSVIKNEKSTAQEVKTKEEKLRNRTGIAEQAIEKAKSAMERSVHAVEDMTKKNPKHWTFKKYVSADGDVLSVVRAPEEVLEGLEIVCKENESLTKTVIGEHEELLSNVVSLDPQDATLKKPVLIAIRYTPTVRITGYEVVVKARDKSGDWKVVATNSTERNFDEIRGLTFAEVKAEKLSTYVVVRRIVRDRHSMGRRGGTVTSSIEPRVTVKYLKDTFLSSTDVTLQVIPTDTHHVHARKQKWDTLKYIVSASPILHITHARDAKAKKTLVITLPVYQLVPHDEEEKKDEEKASSDEFGFGMAKSQQRQGQQKKKKEEPRNTGEVLFMGRNGQSSWEQVKGAELRHRQSGGIEAKVSDGYDRVLAIQMKEGSAMPPPKAAASLEMTSLVKTVNIILHHLNEDRARAIVQIVPAHRCEEVEKQLLQKGFDGPPFPSNEVEIREEQEVSVKFKENIKLMNAYEDKTIIFREAFSNRMEFFLEAADPYRNHSSDFDRGLAEFYKKDSDISRVNVDPSEIQDDWKHMAELAVSLPKVEREFRKKKSMKEAINCQYPLSNDGLRDLAKELGKELEALGDYLGMQRGEVQRIQRDHPDNTEDQFSDLLITWRNKTKLSEPKVSILADALKKCGRTDLAEKLRLEGVKNNMK